MYLYLIELQLAAAGLVHDGLHVRLERVEFLIDIHRRPTVTEQQGLEREFAVVNLRQLGRLDS